MWRMLGLAARLLSAGLFRLGLGQIRLGTCRGSWRRRQLVHEVAEQFFPLPIARLHGCEAPLQISKSSFKLDTCLANRVHAAIVVDATFRSCASLLEFR